MRIFEAFIILSSFILFSCDSSFSKYEKKGKNDLEKSDVKGEVKEIQRFWNGELTEVISYNKFGYITKKIKYEDGQIESTEKYTYDEYGCLVKEEYEGSRCKSETNNTYDEFHNLITSYYNIIEAYVDDVTVGKKLHAMHEYEYDSSGNILLDTIKDGNSTSNGNYSIYKYNLKGEEVEHTIIADNGAIQSIWRTQYYADGKHHRTLWYNGNGALLQYWESNYQDDYNSTYTSYQPVSDPFVKKYKYDANHNITSEDINGDITSFEYEYDEKKNIVLKRVIRNNEVGYTEAFKYSYY